MVSDYCTVELVGSIEVTGNTATFEFRGVGSGITGYICKLNGSTLPDCKSKYSDTCTTTHQIMSYSNCIQQLILMSSKQVQCTYICSKTGDNNNNSYTCCKPSSQPCSIYTHLIFGTAISLMGFVNILRNVSVCPLLVCKSCEARCV